MLDAAGDIIITGTTPPGLQVTAGSLQPSFPGPTTPPAYAGFVMKMDAAAQELIFSTYFGAVDPFMDFGLHGLLGDSQGTIWITGASLVEELPVPKGSVVLGELYLAALSPAGSSLAAIFTAPAGAAGVAIALTSGGVTAMGNAGTLLTASPGQGPSLVGVGNAAGNSVSNAIAPYELISLYGLGIGPQTPAGAQVVSGVVTNSLGGVQVLFDGRPAPLLYVGPTQINAVVPSEVYGQDTSTLQIVTPSGTLNGPTMNVRPSQPGVFLGSGGIFFTPTAAALNQDGSVNSAANPAELGSIVTVWVSGTGVSSNPQADGTILLSQFSAGGPTFPVAMYYFPQLTALGLGALPAGNLSLEVLYAGDAVGMVAGVTQINFQLPAQVESVGNLAFSLQIGEAYSNAFANIRTAPAIARWALFAGGRLKRKRRRRQLFPQIFRPESRTKLVR
jgi:uncharacterized protein (TIGR03437 family)